MDKDFDRWNTVKKLTNSDKPHSYTIRDIWWCRWGINVGTEIDGKDKLFGRPCLILRGFGTDSCFVVPLSTSGKKHPLRMPIGKVEGKNAYINLSQMKTIDTRRLTAKICSIDKRIFNSIRKAARNLF